MPFEQVVSHSWVSPSRIRSTRNRLERYGFEVAANDRAASRPRQALHHRCEPPLFYWDPRPFPSPTPKEWMECVSQLSRVIFSRTSDRSMQPPGLVDFLTQSELFRGVNDAAIRSIAAEVRTATLRDGEVLIRQHEFDRHLYLVVMGRLRVSGRTSGGDWRVLSYVERGGT